MRALGQIASRKILKGLLLGSVVLFTSAQANAQASIVGQAGPGASPQGRETDDPFNQINTVLLRDGKVVDFSSVELPNTAVSREGSGPGDNSRYGEI